MRVSPSLRGIKKYAHCNKRKFMIMVSIFFMLILFKEMFIKASIVMNDAPVSEKDYSVSPFHISSDIYNSSTVRFKGSSYFMSLSYFEQLTCATRNLLTAGSVAQNFGAKVVIPFLLRSRLYGIPDLIPNKEEPDVFYPLHAVYDMAQLNKTFHIHSNTYLVDFEDFIYNAPREIVMIDSIHEHIAPKEFGLNPKTINEIKYIMKLYSFNIFDCEAVVFRRAQPLLEKIKLMLRVATRRLGVKEFEIKKYLCINSSEDITTDQLRELIGPDPYSIIFTQWRGCAYLSCDIKGRHKVTSSFRYRILYHSNHTKSKPHVKDIIFPLINTIEATAFKYLQYLKLYTPFISVHIRIEKLSHINDKIKGHTACCMGILDSLLKSLHYNINHTLLITDVGRYGSDSCHDKVCLLHSRKAKGVLTTMGLVQHGFDPKVINSSSNPAFASLVEMRMLALGNHLIVMGPGSFKHQIIVHFLNSNPANRLYHICTEDGNVLNEFSALNRDCWKDNG